METPELSRPFTVDRIGAGGTAVTVDATAEECAALAKRLMVPQLASFQCRWQLHPSRGGVIQADGQLRATVTQLCIVSLDPFDSTVSEDFTVRFVPAGKEQEEPSDDPDEPDELTFDGPLIDLGEAASEQLALALDPYPRKPGAVLDQDGDADAGGAFAALAKLRNPH